MSGNYYLPVQKTNARQNLMNRSINMNKYHSFMENTKVYYLSEALHYLLDRCLDSGDTDSIGTKEICRTFVRENGYDNLMRDFRTKTYTLALVEQCVSEAVKSTTDKADKSEPLTWIITDTEEAKFFNSLKGLPVDKITQVVNQRVCNAAENFVQKNINMKLDIEEVATKAKQNIEDAKTKYNEELAAKIQKEQTAMYKGRINKIKESASRNIYGHMMSLLSKAVLESEDLKDSYLNESGQFDMGKVESRVKVMYTFLEMVNTFKIKNVNNKYIEECLSSIS